MPANAARARRPDHRRAWRPELGPALTPPAAVHGLVPASDADAAPPRPRRGTRPAAVFKDRTPSTSCATRHASAAATSNAITRAAKHPAGPCIARRVHRRELGQTWGRGVEVHARGRRRRWRLEPRVGHLLLGVALPPWRVGGHPAWARARVLRWHVCGIGVVGPGVGLGAGLGEGRGPRRGNRGHAAEPPRAEDGT